MMRSDEIRSDEIRSDEVRSLARRLLANNISRCILASSVMCLGAQENPRRIPGESGGRGKQESSLA